MIPLLAPASAPAPCTWDNPHSQKQETIQPKVKPGRDEQGNTLYQTCSEAIAERRHAVESDIANRHASTGIAGGTVEDCYYTPPKTASEKNPEPIKLTVNKIDEKKNGEPIYESCTDAQRRAQKEWIDTKYRGHLEDAQADIDEFNRLAEEEAMSATEKAQKAAEKQERTSLIAGAGAMAAGVAFGICCSSGCTSGCYYFAALAAGLGGASMLLRMSSDKNEDIAAQLSDGLMGEDGTSTGTTDGETTSPGEFTGGGGPRPPDPSPPPLDIPKVGPVRPTPGNIRRVLADQGLDFDPKTGTITLPDGRKFSGDDLNDPAIQKYANTPQATALKKQLEGLEQQINQALGADDEGEEELASDEDGNSLSGGGGGFAGYGKGGDSGGGADAGGAGGAGAGRLLASAEDPDADKNSRVAGMSVQRGKDRIGVSEDNIFEIIHRRYQSKRQKQHFIEISR